MYIIWDALIIMSLYQQTNEFDMPNTSYFLDLFSWDIKIMLNKLYVQFDLIFTIYELNL